MALKENDKGLISYSHPESIISEQYRTIRANIHFSSLSHKYQTILITSPGYGEGKSVTAANLAISMAQQGGKVVIIDADLRKPTLHNLFHIDNQLGLANVLIGETTVEEAVKQTEMKGLEILTSGPVPVNPVELLSSPNMDQLIRTIKERYDLVLFDSSPILEVTDGRVLSHQCEGTILVLCKGKTKVEEATEAKRLLKLAKANCVGVIFNYK